MKLISLSLKDTVDLFAVNEKCRTPGDYTKIRLQASGLRLVVDDEDGNDNIRLTVVDLVANGKIDLNPTRPFHDCGG